MTHTTTNATESATISQTHLIHEIHHCIGVTIRVLQDVCAVNNLRDVLVCEHTFTDVNDEPGTPEVRAKAWGEGFAACLRSRGAVVGWTKENFNEPK